MITVNILKKQNEYKKMVNAEGGNEFGNTESGVIGVWWTNTAQVTSLNDTNII